MTHPMIQKFVREFNKSSRIGLNAKRKSDTRASVFNGNKSTTTTVIVTKNEKLSFNGYTFSDMTVEKAIEEAENILE